MRKKYPFEIENELAENLGWNCIKDNNRSSTSDAFWSMFRKDGVVVWSSYPIWCRRTSDDKLSHHNSLEDALNDVNAIRRKFLLPDGRWGTV